MTSDARYKISKLNGSRGTSGNATPWPTDSVEVSPSKRDLIDTWFIEPLRRMNGHQGFICLSTCLVLYEKYLRNTGPLDEDKHFSKGHKVFQQIGKDFSINEDQAYEFWTCWRNGFAHHGLPKKSEIFDWGLTGDQDKIVIISGSSFVVNPWLMRDKILNKIEQKKSIWNDDVAPLMKVFRINKT
jgi:hypothetical protein